MAKPNWYARNGEYSDALSDRKRSVRMNVFSRGYFRSLTVLGALALALIFMAACHKGSGLSITVNVVPSGTQNLDAGHSQNFTAIVAGDATNKGVKWTLTLNSNICSSGTGATCGTLTNATNTTVTYTAPNVSGTTSITLTATAIADPIATGTVTLSIQIPPQFVAGQSIPTAAQNGIPYSATIKAQDGVAPLTFSLVGVTAQTPCGTAGNLPCGLQLNPLSGIISGTPTYTGAQPATYPFSVQITDFNGVTAAAPLALAITVSGPPALSATAALPQAFVGGPYIGTISPSGGVPPLTFGLSSGNLPGGLTLNPTSGTIGGVPTAAGTSNFSVTVTDSALPTHQSFPVSGSITVSAPPALHVITSSLPTAQAAIGYTALLQAQGGIPPYTWSLVPGGQLPAGLSLSTNSNDSTGTISGNPILADQNGYVSNFQVAVTDSSLPTHATALSPNFSLPVATGTANLNTLLTGTYTFLFKGYDTGGPVFVVGTLTMDGAGNISSGFEDYSSSTVIKQGATLSGTYKVGLNGADGRGTLHLVANPGVQSELDTDFQIVLESDGSIRMIQNNSTNSNNDATGVHGSGVMRPVTQATFTTSALSGNYAFLLSGQDFAAKEEAIGGIFHANGVNLLSPVSGDINDNGSFAPLQSPSGSFSFTAASLRGSATLLYSLQGKAQAQLTFAFYFVSSSDVFFVETDQPTNTNQFPRLAGEALLEQTNATFGASSFAGTSVLSGSGFAGGNATVLAGLLKAATCDGATSDVSLSYDQNAGGTTTSVIALATPCSVASNGRATFGSIDPRLAAAYLIAPGEGFFLGSDAAVTTGQIELQTNSTFNVQNVFGTYALSMMFQRDPATAGTIGQVTSSGTGNLPGTLDEVDPPGKPAHLGPSGNLQLTISNLAPSGRGTMISNSLPGLPTSLIFYMVSPTEIRLLPFDSNPGKAHPTLLLLDH